MVSCQWSWIGPLCVFVCAHSLWPGRYVFSSTCSYRPDPGYLTTASSLVPQVIFDEVYDLSRILDDAAPYCSYHKADPKEISTGRIPDEVLPLSCEDREVLTSDYGEMCAVLSNTAEDLRRYKRTTDVFGGLYLKPNNTAATNLKTASPKGSKIHTPPTLQYMTHEGVSSFTEKWQMIYNMLVTPGMRFARDIEHYLDTLTVLRPVLSEARAKVARARQDVINKWPLISRSFYDLGLLRGEAVEVGEHNSALEFLLDPWLTATIRHENLLTLVSSNVTATYEDLDARVAAGFSDDAWVRFGPPAALNVPNWLSEIRRKGRSSIDRVEREDARVRGKGQNSDFDWLLLL
ncbi:MAG: hypothetical protein Q9221_007886 [Calogaya cf. arnoldii]